MERADAVLLGKFVITLLSLMYAIVQESCAESAGPAKMSTP